MALIRGHNLTLAFGARPVLEQADITIEASQRIALLGRNGEGKSTLLKLLAGQIDADSGELVRRTGLNTAYLPQSVPTDLHGSVYSIVASGLDHIGDILTRYNELSSNFEQSDEHAKKLARLQDEIDTNNAWEFSQRVEEVISKMSLNGDAEVGTLSGGMKRRVLLAKALVTKPDLLLLDEPTNHLDIGAIDWLEGLLAGLECSLVFVSHDRSFLNAVANHIIELDRGKLQYWPGNYQNYLVKKQEQLEVEANQNALFDKKLAQEEAWIRQGIKARRTRNEGRVRALKALREEHRQRRNRTGPANLTVNQAERSGKMVFEADELSIAFDGAQVIDKLSITVLRQDRLGIIGPNGCGKSTLVNLLTEKLTPDSGTLRVGTQLEIAYFDQLRTSLDQNLSAADNVSGGQDNLMINGQNRHIMSYMQDFLFTPDRARAPITALSGGETSRLMLAKLFLKPSNLLILDEPSNDLDIETLELLEQLVQDYAGTVILISHDRELIDNVVTRSLVYQGPGKFIEVIGGYADFLREYKQNADLVPVFDNNDAQAARAKTQSTEPENKKAKQAVKLSYKLQRELDALPEQISKLESKIEATHEAMSASDFYDDKAKAEKTIAQSDELQQQLDAAYNRWAEIEDMASGA